jgi:hypothetical protein
LVARSPLHGRTGAKPDRPPVAACGLASPVSDPRPPTDRYGLLLFLLLGLVAIAPSVSTHELARIGALVLAVTSLATMLRAVGSSPEILRRAAVAGLVLGAAASWASTSDASEVRSISVVVVACVLATGPILLIPRIFRRRAFDVQDIMAGLSAYLLIGLVFTFIYTAIDLYGPEPFFAQGSAEGGGSYIYFSFVTMLTIGYGDLTPASDLGRGLIIMQTLLGQIILIVLIAYLVGKVAGRDLPGAGSRPPVDGPRQP